MKKIICLLAIMSLVFGVVPMVSAQTVEVSASSYCDFFDASGALCEKGTQEGSVILRSGEWIKFNLKELCLAEGNYTFSLSQANVAENAANKKDLVFVDILLDGNMILKKEMKPTASSSNFENVKMGNIYISEEAQYLTIRNSALHSLSAIDVANFSLIPTDDVAFCEVTYSGLNVISTTDGEGYHDVASQDFWSNSVTPLGVSCGAVMLHGTGDWVAYDISELPAGSYDITILSGERVMPKLSIFVDEHIKFSASSVNLSGAYGTYTETYIGNIYITEKSNILKIQNLAQATEIRSVNLKKVSDSLTIKAKDYDDYDSNGTNLNVTGNSVTLESYEWVKFNIEDLELSEGNYTLSICQSNKAGVKNKVFLDVVTEMD